MISATLRESLSWLRAFPALFSPREQAMLQRNKHKETRVLTLAPWKWEPLWTLSLSWLLSRERLPLAEETRETRVLTLAALATSAFLDSEPFLTPFPRAAVLQRKQHRTGVLTLAALTTRSFIDSEPFFTPYPRADWAPAEATQGTRVFTLAALTTRAY